MYSFSVWTDVDASFLITLNVNKNIEAFCSHSDNYLQYSLDEWFFCYRVNALDSGSVVNIGNGPPSGPSLYSRTMGRKVAYQFIMR